MHIFIVTGGSQAVTMRPWRDCTAYLYRPIGHMAAAIECNHRNINAILYYHVSECNYCNVVIKAKFHDAIQLANQLASWSMQAASELDSVMKFGLSCTILLASTSLAGRRPPVCDQVRAISTCRDSLNLSAAGRSWWQTC